MKTDDVLVGIVEWKVPGKISHLKKYNIFKSIILVQKNVCKYLGPLFPGSTYFCRTKFFIGKKKYFTYRPLFPERAWPTHSFFRIGHYN